MAHTHPSPGPASLEQTPHEHSHGHDHEHGHADHDHADHDHDSDDSGHDHGHDHGHGHHHHGPGHVHAPANFGAAFAIGISLNVAYVIAEAIWGVLAHAMALLADAGHNLSDILGLLAAWVAQHLARRAPSARFTYGLRRSTILSALGNATVLLIVTGGVIWESMLRLWHPEPVAGRVVMIVAAVGILVNGGTALLFARGSKGDLNLRGVFTHMAADALMALGVVVTGFVIMLTGWRVLDPIVSLVVSGIVIVSTWSLLRGSLDLALDAVPPGLDEPTVAAALRGLDGVVDLHDLHIWPMSTTETALTAHLVHDPLLASNALDALLRTASSMLRARFGIVHVTLQLEMAPCESICALHAGPSPA
ncbi:cation diffusion facilitator family transporter [Tanticharoenia sakaeratensis]|uniref:cation diffusion facilitator family transporter n=1 Tax=Tanticharoenia sakaeratensis TaxID=444053 RepID=UPI000662C11F|nr:cation diffusion facilitator family transporter [Tanticharoenia sakaeratensis]